MKLYWRYKKDDGNWSWTPAHVKNRTRAWVTVFNLPSAVEEE